MDLVDKYITEIEDQGCTKLACISREWFDMHALEERPHELPIWNENLALKKVVDYISYDSTNKSVYSSIDLVDRGIMEMKNLGGKGFSCFCNEFFVITDITLTCEQPQKYIL